MFGSRCDDIPYLYNWMDASAHEAEVKPIRGRSDCKPLGKRSKTHQTIRRDADDAVICKLYNTDVVTYHKDGRIDINFGGWASQTTMKFIGALLRVYLRQAHNRMWMQCKALNRADAIGWYPVWTDGPNLCKRNGSGDLDFLNSFTPAMFTHRINRKRTNNVRSKFKAFKDYLYQNMKIRDEGFSTQEFGDMFGWLRHDLPNYPAPMYVGHGFRSSKAVLEEFLQLAESTQAKDHYKASLYLVRTAGNNRRHKRETWDASTDAMYKTLDEIMLCVHRDECFEEVPIKDGEIVRDPYLKYFD